MTFNHSVLPNTSALHLLQLNYNMTMTLLPVTILIGMESAIGCVGNILILIIYYKCYEISNFRCFVLFVAVIDLTNCLTSMPIEMFGQMHWYKFDNDWLCKVKSYFLVFTTWGSATILSLLAFDRHRKICQPLQWQIQPSLALKLCITSIVISACVAIPIMFLWGKQSYIYLHEDIPINVSICEKAGQYADSIYPFVYLGCVYIGPVGIMLLFVSFVNIRIAKKLFCGMYSKTSCTIRFLRSSNIFATNSDASATHAYASDDTGCLKRKVQQFRTRRVCQNAYTVKFLKSRFPCYSKKESKMATAVILTGIKTLSNEPKTITEHDDTALDSKKDVNVKNAICRITTYNKMDKNCSNDLPVAPCISRSAAATTVNQQQCNTKSHRKRKTIIMLILTSVYTTTMSVYVVLISIVARKEGTVKDLTNLQKVVFFFFLRLFFINSAVNSVLYGVLDPRFRQGLMKILLRK